MLYSAGVTEAQTSPPKSSAAKQLVKVMNATADAGHVNLEQTINA